MGFCRADPISASRLAKPHKTVCGPLPIAILPPHLQNQLPGLSRRNIILLATRVVLAWVARAWRCSLNDVAAACQVHCAAWQCGWRIDGGSSVYRTHELAVMPQNPDIKKPVDIQ